MPANTNKIYQLKITLKKSKPSIWRRFLVKSDIILPDLHKIIQTVMGWTNSHLHHFIVDNLLYGIPDEDYPDDTVEYYDVRLNELLQGKGSRFIYEYDFGDGWEHLIELEEILDMEDGKYYPVCITGKNACPPEDCGGVWGYKDLLGIIKNPKNKRYKEMMEWLGGRFDPEYFDLKDINEMLETDDYGCITIFE